MLFVAYTLIDNYLVVGYKPLYRNLAVASERHARTSKNEGQRDKDLYLSPSRRVAKGKRDVICFTE